MAVATILGYVLAFIVGWAAWFFGYKRTLTIKALQFKAKMAKVKEIEEDIIDKARNKAESIIEHAENKAEKESEKRYQKIDSIEARLIKREERFDEKIVSLNEEKEKLTHKQQEIETIKEQQKQKLEEIAKISYKEAKAELLETVEQNNQDEMLIIMEKYKGILKEETDKEAAHVLAKALPRIANDSVSEFTTSTVDLPNEDYKGKLIGREWRNISFFEKTTGVELIVDDTPLLVRLSSYDAEKRYQATITLEKLVKDGRINPHYIEKTYQDVVAHFDEHLMDKGKEALQLLNIPMMKPDIVRYVGQFHLRYSYGQNLRIHSIEVAKICEAIAAEMWIETELAKKAWLLHDIGKIIAQNGESHTVAGADLLTKYSMDKVIINAAASHHYDVEMTHPISRIVAAADAISASRPWARFNTKDLFIEKMSELEKLIKEVSWVKKVHIMQAGREIIVFVDPEHISDIQVEELLKTIGAKIEDQLDYPGIIRVTWLRETKIIQYLR